MADNYIIKKSTLTAIGDAIRSKTETTTKMKPTDMPAKILAIESGGAELSTITVDANFAKGDQVVESADEKSGYSKVTITKPTTLKAENIASGVTIAGITGTGTITSLPVLAKPTISKSNGTMSISTPSSNGDYDTQLRIYNYGTLFKTISTTSSWSMESNCSKNTTYEFYVTCYGSKFVESEGSNTITWGKYDWAFTNTDGNIEFSAGTSGTKYYGESISGTFSTAGEVVAMDLSTDVTISNPSSSSYTFALTDSGYIESNNKSMNSTYAYAKLTFTLAQQISHLYVDYVSSGENNCDYGTISKIDTSLTQSTSDDSTSNYQGMFKGQASTETKTLDFGAVSAGEHFITIKFKKDGSASSGNDSLRIMAIRVQNPAVGIYLPATISVTMEGTDNPSYTYDPLTGSFTMNNISGKVAIAIESTNIQLLHTPVIKKSGKVITWEAIDGAVGYAVYQYCKDDSTTTLMETTTELTYTIAVEDTDLKSYQYWIVAKGNGETSQDSAISNKVLYSNGVQIYGVSFIGNALDGTRIDDCEGVTNDEVGIGYYGETSKASNWFDDKDPFQFEIVNLTMRDSSGNALVDSSTGETITAPFVKRKNFWVKITAHTDDDGETWEIATMEQDGYTPIYTTLEGEVPEYFYQPCYPFCTLTTTSGTFYGAQKGGQVTYSHNFNNATHYSQCAYVGTDDGLALQPLITMRKCVYDANLPLFYIEFACRNSQRFFNKSYSNYGRSKGSGANYVGALDDVASSSATYTQGNPYSQASTYSVSESTYKYRGQECCFNAYYWIVGDVTWTGKYAKSYSELTSGQYSNFTGTITYQNQQNNGYVTTHMQINADSRGIYPISNTGSSTYNSVYYCDAVYNSSSNPLIFAGGSDTYSNLGCACLVRNFWGSADSYCGSRPCLSVC